MRTFFLLPGLLCLALSSTCQGATLATMTPAAPLSEARLAALPAAERASWSAYLARSRAAMAADREALAAERPDPAGMPARAHAGNGRGMSLREPAAWYGTLEALRVADNILSFQTPTGGWGKNADRLGPPRRPGEHWVPPEAGQRKNSWSFVGTFDNNATIGELRFLARVQAQLPGTKGDAYRKALEKGLRYVLAAQYPNGGFPQVYPLQGGYHDAVTLNDGAMMAVTELLMDVGEARGDFAAVAPALAQEARAAAGRTLSVFLKTQQASGGKRSGWGQQYDPLTLALAGARKYEPAALASGESAGVLHLLMRVPDPSSEVREAVHQGVAWLRSVALRDVAWKSVGAEGRRLVPEPGAPEIWARYYDIDSMKPVFGERDGTIHDDVNELQIERRNGYAWFSAAPGRALVRYADWAKQATTARLILVGDSTIEPNGGYGDALCRRLAPAVACVNLGRAGRSTSSYRAEGHWDKVRKVLAERGAFGTTYVMIGFGHNDQPGKPGRSTDLRTEFPANMARYVNEAQALGAVPLLATPLARRTFENGKLADTLAPWAAATRAVAAREQLAVVDVHAATLARFAELGEARTVTLGPPPKADAKGPDLTHLNAEGAEIVAPIVLRLLSDALPGLTAPAR